MIGNDYHLGKKASEETKMKQSIAHKGKTLGENNSQWKGDEVSYRTLHQWINRHLPKPEVCEICKQNKSLHVANITGVYNRDFKNWRYMCPRCHWIFDGRETNLKQYRHLKEHNEK